MRHHHAAAPPKRQKAKAEWAVKYIKFGKQVLYLQQIT
jgi:hypothetical protein